MIPVWVFAIITIVSVFLALKLKKKWLFALPLLAVGSLLLVEIIKVPLPLWETIQFIFNLRG
ncbi:hypothetical protein [Paenisporosarcina sp. TG20]|uniref:hypothetical protein n=1 Tax=Paenisporosarcina sp. TG20 TaxID=1211706 RepID=UPI0002D84BE5|nr:hypothetical protein [Paenisporosarcina sp. TG20]